VDRQNARPQLDVIERSTGEGLELHCPRCLRVVFVIRVDEPRPGEKARLVEASHAIECAGRPS
jgi:hypothetical protein